MSAKQADPPAETPAAPAEAPLPSARKGLRVLHLEDDRIHAETVRQMVASEFPGSRHTVVASRFAYLGELQLRPFDLIVSDFSLESFNGLEALDLARQRAPHLPFVFYSSTIGADRAAQALQHGARDYVPKGELQRLRTTIKRIAAEKRQPDAPAGPEPRQKLSESVEALVATQQRVEEQAQRIQRLENVGLLAAGAAHDLNNMLSPMLMAVPLLRESMPDAEGKRFLDTLEKSAQRAARLVAQIMAFAQENGGQMTTLGVDGLLRDFVKFMLETFPKNIRIESAIQPGLWRVKANRAQVHQALLNLCVNARDAMPGGGTLTVGGENCFFDEVAAQAVPNAREGSFVMLRIEDTGVGIGSEEMARIWETGGLAKPENPRLPLGLPTVRSIAHRHGGFVEARTTLGVGSSFRVYLPTAE
jgi:signal transduction histidine kinase